jgi:hypothetical protein
VGSNPARGDEFLSLMKIRSTPSFEGEGKHYVKILWHVKEPIEV